ncbi:paeninodin family lasso peptide [Salipaludibacillus aurantiacus]|uniref:Paeninodin family lasso peptide n=1 Tax=Salipaludibacillus aurantiacus TaxID=1601833 RepID=A0A1H9UL30_9BACI|nr:paeninodin family lasso peptide [Salipaludibacillus aurantiacus]SES10008.1 hypothetical protein SAMN05518684_10811 [Salipaludibacillus aurantiacus]
MKKEWKEPELQELDLNMTMLGNQGEHLDNDFSAGTSFSDITFS